MNPKALSNQRRKIPKTNTHYTPTNTGSFFGRTRSKLLRRKPNNNNESISKRQELTADTETTEESTYESRSYSSYESEYRDEENEVRDTRIRAEDERNHTSTITPSSVPSIYSKNVLSTTKSSTNEKANDEDVTTRVNVVAYKRGKNGENPKVKLNVQQFTRNKSLLQQQQQQQQQQHGKKSAGHDDDDNKENSTAAAAVTNEGNNNMIRVQKGLGTANHHTHKKTSPLFTQEKNNGILKKAQTNKKLADHSPLLFPSKTAPTPRNPAMYNPNKKPPLGFTRKVVQQRKENEKRKPQNSNKKKKDVKEIKQHKTTKAPVKQEEIEEEDDDGDWIPIPDMYSIEVSLTQSAANMFFGNRNDNNNNVLGNDIYNNAQTIESLLSSAKYPIHTLHENNNNELLGEGDNHRVTFKNPPPIKEVDVGMRTRNNKGEDDTASALTTPTLINSQRANTMDSYRANNNNNNNQRILFKLLNQACGIGSVLPTYQRRAVDDGPHVSFDDGKNVVYGEEGNGQQNYYNNQYYYNSPYQQQAFDPSCKEPQACELIAHSMDSSLLPDSSVSSAGSSSCTTLIRKTTRHNETNQQEEHELEILPQDRELAALQTLYNRELLSDIRTVVSSGTGGEESESDENHNEIQSVRSYTIDVKDAEVESVLIDLLEKHNLSPCNNNKTSSRRQKSSSNLLHLHEKTMTNDDTMMSHLSPRSMKSPRHNKDILHLHEKTMTNDDTMVSHLSPRGMKSPRHNKDILHLHEKTMTNDETLMSHLSPRSMKSPRHNKDILHLHEKTMTNDDTMMSHLSPRSSLKSPRNNRDILHLHEKTMTNEGTIVNSTSQSIISEPEVDSSICEYKSVSTSCLDDLKSQNTKGTDGGLRTENTCDCTVCNTDRQNKASTLKEIQNTIRFVTQENTDFFWNKLLHLCVAPSSSPKEEEEETVHATNNIHVNEEQRSVHYDIDNDGRNNHKKIIMNTFSRISQHQHSLDQLEDDELVPSSSSEQSEEEEGTKHFGHGYDARLHHSIPQISTETSSLTYETYS